VFSFSGFVILAFLPSWVVPLVSFFSVFGAAGSGFPPPPFRPVILPPSQTLSEAFRRTLAVFALRLPASMDFPDGTVRAMFTLFNG
jgi:hypothetical protein